MPFGCGGGTKWGRDQDGDQDGEKVVLRALLKIRVGSSSPRDVGRLLLPRRWVWGSSALCLAIL